MLVDVIGTIISIIGFLFLTAVGLFVFDMIKSYIKFMRNKNDIN